MTALIKYHWCEHGMHINETSPSMHYYRGAEADAGIGKLEKLLFEKNTEIIELEAKLDQSSDKVHDLWKINADLESELEDLKKALGEATTKGGTG